MFGITKFRGGDKRAFLRVFSAFFGRRGMSCLTVGAGELWIYSPKVCIRILHFFSILTGEMPYFPPLRRENRGRDFHNWKNGIIFARGKGIVQRDNTELQT